MLGRLRPDVGEVKDKMLGRLKRICDEAKNCGEDKDRCGEDR
jgi:hypothetical protein